ERGRSPRAGEPAPAAVAPVALRRAPVHRLRRLLVLLLDVNDPARGRAAVAPPGAGTAVRAPRPAALRVDGLGLALLGQTARFAVKAANVVPSLQPKNSEVTRFRRSN